MRVGVCVYSVRARRHRIERERGTERYENVFFASMSRFQTHLEVIEHIHSQLVIYAQRIRTHMAATYTHTKRNHIKVVRSSTSTLHRHRRWQWWRRRMGKITIWSKWENQKVLHHITSITITSPLIVIQLTQHAELSKISKTIYEWICCCCRCCWCIFFSFSFMSNSAVLCRMGQICDDICRPEVTALWNEFFFLASVVRIFLNVSYASICSFR